MQPEVLEHFGRSVQLRTRRLVLRRYRAHDAQHISKAIEESRLGLEQWTPEIASRCTVEEVSAGLRMLEEACGAQRKLVFGMFDRRGGEFVGEVGLYTIDWESSWATIGIWVRDVVRGRGLAREGFLALARYAHEVLGLARLDAHIHPNNQRSRQLALRAGFRLSGTIAGSEARHGTTGEVLVYRHAR